jgi:hypothetical protein
VEVHRRWTTRLLNQIGGSHRRAGRFQSVVHEPKFVLSADIENHRNVPVLLERLEPLERLELSASCLNLERLQGELGSLMQKGGLWSPREDIGSLTQKFKNPTSTRNTVSKKREKYAEWDKLMQQLFVRRR